MTNEMRAVLVTLAASAVSVVLALALGGCAFDVDSSTLEGDAVAAPIGDEKEIVGGTATTIAQHPWQISFQTSDGFHFCGGSILSDTWIVTAQHCVEGASPSSVRIEAGATRLSESGQVRSVAEIVRHPGYTQPANGKDIALLRLSTPLTL